MVLITPSVTWQDTSIKTVNQIDIVPTLSLLFGVPTPRNSLGKLIPELFATLPRECIHAITNTSRLIYSISDRTIESISIECASGSKYPHSTMG
jgi:hypothetical protein